jgi:hypothetical protein
MRTQHITNSDHLQKALEMTQLKAGLAQTSYLTLVMLHQMAPGLLPSAIYVRLPGITVSHQMGLLHYPHTTVYAAVAGPWRDMTGRMRNVASCKRCPDLLVCVSNCINN